MQKFSNPSYGEVTISEDDGYFRVSQLVDGVPFISSLIHESYVVLVVKGLKNLNNFLSNGGQVLSRKHLIDIVINRKSTFVDADYDMYSVDMWKETRDSNATYSSAVSKFRKFPVDTTDYLTVVDQIMRVWDYKVIDPR